MQWLQSHFNTICLWNTITCRLKGSLIPGHVPLSRSGADNMRFSGNPQTFSSCVVALIPSLSAGGEGPRLKLCSHQDQTGTVPLLPHSLNQRQDLSSSPGPKEQLKRFTHSFKRCCEKKSRQARPSHTSCVTTKPDLFACVHV